MATLRVVHDAVYKAYGRAMAVRNVLPLLETNPTQCRHKLAQSVALDLVNELNDLGLMLAKACMLGDDDTPRESAADWARREAPHMLPEARR